MTISIYNSTMDSNKLKPFAKLQHTDDVLILDWMGGVVENIDEIDNPLIDCYFTPTYLDTSQSPPKLRRIQHRQFRAGISAGEIVSTHIGQYYQHGTLIDLNNCPKIETIIYDIDTNDTETIHETTLASLKLDSGPKLVDWPLYQPAKHSCYKVLEGRLIDTDHPKWENRINNHPQPFQVLLHEIELIRYYYTNSSHSSKKVFTGAFSNDRISHEVVNTLHEHYGFRPDLNAHRFVYRHGYTKDDALTLGRILFDPDNHALRSVQRVKKQIDCDRINYKQDDIGYPRTYFPFKGKSRLILCGRRLKLKGNNNFIFLTHRIKQCSGEFPFDRLSYCDEITPGNKPADKDSNIAFSGYNKKLKGPGHNEEIGSSVNNSPPNSRAETLKAQLGERIFTDSKRIELVFQKTRNSTHRSDKNTSSYDESLINASTGCGTSTGKSIPQKITAKILKPSAVAPDLDTFIKIIQSLRILKSEWSIRTLTIGNGYIHETNNESYSFFPEVPCRVKKSIMRQFSFMDEDKNIARCFICAEIRANDKYLYLFESEKRIKDTKNSSGISEYKDKIPFLLLYKSGFPRCDSSDFLNTIHKTVIRSTWPSKEDLDGFIRDHTVHGKGVQSVNEITSRVLSLIHKNIDVANETN